MEENKDLEQITQEQAVQNENLNNPENTGANNKIVVKPEKEKLNTMSKISIVIFNLALIAFIASACFFLSPVITILYYLILICIIILLVVLTLGIIFVAAPKVVPNLWKLLVNGGAFLTKLSGHLIKIFPYVLAVCLVLSIISIVLFAVNMKKQKHPGRFGFSIAFAVISIVGLLLILL